MSLPADVPAYRAQPTDVVDVLTRIIPSQTSAITVGSTQQKLKIELPNVKTARMGQMIVQCDISAAFSSTDNSDTYAGVVPTFVPLISSIIQRWTLTLGSVIFCDNYANDLRTNLQYWLRSNSITRLDDLYLYPTTPGLQPANGSSTTVRFPLVFDPADFPSKRGTFPFGILPKATLDLYFNPASQCMYIGGTAAGTVTFTYTVSNV